MIHHRSMHRIHPALSPCCVCNRCADARAGWLAAWTPLLARLAEVTPADAWRTNPDALLAIAVQKLTTQKQEAAHVP